MGPALLAVIALLAACPGVAIAQQQKQQQVWTASGQPVGASGGSSTTATAAAPTTPSATLSSAAAGTSPAASAPLGAFARPASLNAACQAAALSDLPQRLANPGFAMTTATTKGSSGSRRGLLAAARSPARAAHGTKAGSWGPDVITFPPAAAPRGACGGGNDAIAWAQFRVSAVVRGIVEAELCYCHHHALWWMPPPGAEDVCNPDCPGTRARPRQGADCSNYSSYLYNVAFGTRFTSAIGKQACKPGAAPGVTLPYTNAQQDQLKPGDLLFITQSGDAGAGPPPVRVSHVVVWTGLTADFLTSGLPLSWDTLLSAMRPWQRPAAAAYAQRRTAAGQPVYVISDSHWTGPNYRPFAGWYVENFSHARRVLFAAGSPEAAFPTDDPSVARWDGTDCLSMWALNGRGAGGAGGR